MNPTAQEQRERQERLDAESAAMRAGAEATARQYTIVALGDNEGPVQWGELGRGNSVQPLGFLKRKAPDFPGQLVALLADCSSAARDERNAQTGVLVNP